MRKLIIILILPLLVAILCSCDKRSIEANDIYGKWIPLEKDSSLTSSECIYLFEDGTFETFNFNWKDIGVDSINNPMPKTGVWSMENEYENPGGLYFMRGKAVHFLYKKHGFSFVTGWFRWKDDRITLLFCVGDPDNYELVEYKKVSSIAPNIHP